MLKHNIMAADTDVDVPSVQQRQVLRYTNDALTTAMDDIAEETAIALVYNGISHVVMMSTPKDLYDLAIGFSLSEKIVDDANEILDISATKQALGIEVNITVSNRAVWRLKQQRRNMTGRTGCGLCGAESLQQAMKNQQSTVADEKKNKQAPRELSELTNLAIQKAVLDLQAHQPLQQMTGAVHAAAWCDENGDIQLIREDIGRHNALDKLIGALNATNIVINHSSFLLISSRASYEMISKAHVAGISLLVAVSAPTALAINIAKNTGMTLVGFARNGRHTIYS
ncbi:formate dehydrogenase accessory sulfurtransferase FdhD [Colwellia psychrerythraea]|uniref:formate dehydrogenase accessory sulfurtransferase FdhD n=1 Tax=Colwellia psychrerythraea TaxID=28229 RepID=UPI00068B7DA7|nr:formate dehydrogenase accessory sulfurtransferase FdhD [Colwellia psychrerythraea]